MEGKEERIALASALGGALDALRGEINMLRQRIETLEQEVAEGAVRASRFADGRDKAEPTEHHPG